MHKVILLLLKIVTSFLTVMGEGIFSHMWFFRKSYLNRDSRIGDQKSWTTTIVELLYSYWHDYYKADESMSSTIKPNHTKHMKTGKRVWKLINEIMEDCNIYLFVVFLSYGCCGSIFERMITGLSGGTLMYTKGTIWSEAVWKSRRLRVCQDHFNFFISWMMHR